MFDGLKEKLGKFREDVEETAEEKAEAEAEAAAEADAEGAEPATSTSTSPSADSGSPADAASEGAADTDGSAAADTDASASTGAMVDEESTQAESAEPAEAVAPRSTTPERESDDVADEETEGAAADESASTAAGAGADADTDAETDVGSADAGAADADADAESGSNVPDAVKARNRSESDADAEAELESETESVAGRFKRAKAYATGRIIIEEEDLEEPLWELEMALLESDVEMNVAEEILDTIRETMIGESRKQVDTTAELVQEALHDALFDVISVGQFDFDERVREAEKPVTIIFTGVNGVGKTTSIAKLARYFEDRGLSTVLANGDTYRAGANEQIREHAENLDKRLISHEQGGDPAAVIYDAVEYAEANDVDVVLGDTAGRLHTSNNLMTQLEKIHRVVGPDVTLFVDEAVAGQDAVQRAETFDDAAEIDGAILTKADADSQGGAAISIAYVTGKPILFLGTGQGYDDLRRFEPEELVASLLEAE